MTEQDRFEEFVRAAVNELDPIPQVPRDEMWSRIEAARRFRRPAPRMQPRAVWIAWGVGLAAMLVIGIGLGRISVLQQPANPAVTQVAQSGSQSAAAPNDRAAAADAPRPYALAAMQHLSRVEVLLTTVNSGTIDGQVSTWAKDMLSSTRMLLDSPAADDPRMSQLLEDLELVLMQIASPAARQRGELDLIQHGIQQTDVLPRLRAALPASGAAVGT
jgi:hypothetical protein